MAARSAPASWHFAVLECPLADLKAAAKSAHGSLNDAYVAALLGGLRRYHERHGVHLDDLSMVMPVSLRKADDPMGGNKFAGAYFAARWGSPTRPSGSRCCAAWC